MKDLITHEEINTIITLILVPIGGVLAAFFNEKIKALKEQSKGNKRSSLRNEYLTIYNSDKFTAQEKYNMTREAITEYESLDGNHYIHELDERLESQLAKELSEEK